MDETAPERWTRDDVVGRDVSTDPRLVQEAETSLTKFADDLFALGFVPLGVFTWRMQDAWEEAEVPDDETLARLRDEAAEGDEASAEALSALQQRQTVEEVYRDGTLAWVLLHPDTRDLATLERNGHGDWLTFSRLFEDGAIVRTKRRPDEMVSGSPMVTAAYRDAPMPGLYCAVAWIVGDSFDDTSQPKPHIRQWDRSFRAFEAEAAWQVHCAHVDEVAPGCAAVQPDRALALSMSRRTLHVSLVGMDHAGLLGDRWWFGIRLLGRVLVGAVVGGSTGSWTDALVVALFVPGVAAVLWTLGTGMGDPWGLPLPFGLLLLSAWWVGLPGAVVAGALAAFLPFEFAARLGYLYLVFRGRRWLDRRVRVPEPVRAEDLARYYPA